MNHKRLLGSVVALATAAASLLVATPAMADGPPDELVYSSTAPMHIIGYDKATAEANGYTIVVDQGGTQHSVPVTQKAKAQAADAEALKNVVKPLGDVISYGDCGTSALFISRIGYTGIAVKTGYSVYQASVYHTWNVDGVVTSGTWTSGFSGLNFSNTWSATHNVSVGNNSSGFGDVRYGSQAQLIDGSICLSGDPQMSW